MKYSKLFIYPQTLSPKEQVFLTFHVVLSKAYLQAFSSYQGT